tara:strand:+ start:38947 stop:39156 length:210 start_codon:yes stop_codon:yes gene_type:complete
MAWKDTIQKASGNEIRAIKIIKYARNELNIKGKNLENVLRIALQELQLMRGEKEEERRVDSVAGSRFER